jgi:hypothetical protein
MWAALKDSWAVVFAILRESLPRPELEEDTCAK